MTTAAPDALGHSPASARPAAPWPTLVLALAGLLGTVLVLWHFGFREFYYDCAEQVNLGARVRQAHFLVNRALVSGAGISQPPLSAWFMGVATWISSDPVVLNAMTTVLNLGAFALALWFFRAWLPPTLAALAAILLAVNPAAPFYSNLLWEGSLLQPLAILFQVLAASLLARGRPRDFVLLVLIATAAALCHLAGFLLLPLAAVLGCVRHRQIGTPAILAGLAASALLFAPYAAHLLSPPGQAELRGYLGRGSLAPTDIHVRLHLGMASVYFYRLFFRGAGSSLADVLSRAAPGWGAMAQYLGWLIAAALLAGWARYVAGALRSRRLFSVPEANRVGGGLPIPVQVAGFVLSGVALQYFVSGRALWFKHFIVVYPAYALLPAWAFWRYWESRVVRAAFVVSVVASLALSVALLRHIELKGGTGAHGAIQAYGVSYDRLEGIRRDLARHLPPGEAPELYATGLWQPQIEVAVLRDLPPARWGGTPFLLTVFDDFEGWRFWWSLRPIGEALRRHRAAMGAAVEAVPAGSRIAVFSGLHEYGVPPWLVLGAPDGPLDSLFQRFAERCPTSSYEPGEPVDPGLPYVALDTNEPRSLRNLPPLEVWRLVAAGGFSLIYAEDGIAVLRREPAAAHDREKLVDAFGRFPATTLLGALGRPRPCPDSVAAEVRVGESPDPAGFLVFGPYVSLPPGRYRASFRLRVDGAPGAAPGTVPVKVDVAGGPQHLPLVQAEIVPDHGDRGRWREQVLNFTVVPDGGEQMEFRVFYPGAGTVEVDTVTLTREGAPPG